MAVLQKKVNDKMQCLLCPHNCKISQGKTGICGVRRNEGNEIVLLTYGVLSALSTDPVEKKPLYHFFPGHNILSAGSYGCNMRCDFCQNYHISQNIPDRLFKEVTPERLVDSAKKAEKNVGIAFTYNEPVIWFEYMRDVALTAREAGFYTVMVSNGFVNPGPLEEITGFIDAFNIDLKAFNSRFYRSLTGAELEPVRESLKQIVASDRHLEITTLIIPGQNDDEKEMAAETEWIAGELGPEVPLHLSRYFPMYRRSDSPTQVGMIERLAVTASRNLKYVYAGNVFSPRWQNTECPGCGLTVTIRSGYMTSFLNLDEEGKCTGCGRSIYKHFRFTSS